MTIIIAGAGTVGKAVATVASHKGEVIIVESSPQKAEEAKNTLSASVLNQDATNPKDMESLLKRNNPSVVISSLQTDSLNIYLSFMVKTMTSATKTIATLHDNDFLERDQPPGVDQVIAPRRTVADRIIMCALLENTASFYRINEFGLCAQIFRIRPKSLISGKYISDIKIQGCNIIAVIRNDETIMKVYPLQIHDEDRIFVIGTEDAIREFNNMIGLKNTVRSIVIIGAGDLGIGVAKAIYQDQGKHFVKIIDKDYALCNKAVRALRGVPVINGNTQDPVFLKTENVNRADTVIAVSDLEENNLLTSVNAIRFGVKKIISEYASDEYGDLLRYSGVESVVGYRNAIINEASEKLNMLESRFEDQVFFFERPRELLIQIQIDADTPFVEKNFGDIYPPESINPVAIQRDGEIIFPDILDQCRVGDRVLFYVYPFDKAIFSRFIGRPFTVI